MINFRPPESRDSSMTAEKAISFISKGWREVKDSTEADIQLMKHRAKSFKNLASSFDHEFENFLNSASKSSSSRSPADIEFVRRFQPKLSDIRQVYSSQDFKNNKFMVKVKSSLKAICKEPYNSKEPYV